MNKTSCLNEEDLLLCYYEEIAQDSEQMRHVDVCPHCTERLSLLRNDLAKLPDLHYEADSLAGVRMAARINEKLQQRNRKWLPLLGTAGVAALALVATIVVWSPRSEIVQLPQLASSPTTTINPNEDMPEIDFLEDFELLKELELLSQIEGV